jgi:hypothetical protein
MPLHHSRLGKRQPARHQFKGANSKSVYFNSKDHIILTASSGLTISNLGLYVKSTTCSQRNGIEPRTYKAIKRTSIMRRRQLWGNSMFDYNLSCKPLEHIQSIAYKQLSKLFILQNGSHHHITPLFFLFMKFLPPVPSSADISGPTALSF